MTLDFNETCILNQTLTTDSRDEYVRLLVETKENTEIEEIRDSISYDSLNGLWNEEGFCEISYCCEAASIERMDGPGSSVLVQCEPVRIRAYIRKGS